MAAGDIRAGRAYVEVSALDRVDAGLSKIQAKFKGWAAKLSELGSQTRGGELPEPLAAIGHFLASPAGMFTAMTEFSRRFAEAGAAMLELSEKAGTSVEAISALAYAARRCGVDSAELAGGMKKMQQAIYAAATGQEAGIKASQELGLNLSQLSKLPVEQQFQAIADAVSKIPNPTQRAAAAVAIFGKSGTDMLPMLLKGADGMGTLMARAQELGLVMDRETAEKAKRLEIAFGDLADVTGAAIKAVGGELAGVINSAVGGIVRATVAVKHWVEEHRGLATAVFLGVGAVTALGAAMTIGGAAIGVMSQAFSALRVAIVGFNVVMGICNAIIALNPFVLLGIAIAGVVGYVLHVTGALRALGDWLASVFGPTINEIKAAFSAMGEAMAMGDLKGAWTVAGALLKLEFTKAFFAVLDVWDKIVATVQNAWNTAIDAMSKKARGLLDSAVGLIVKLTGGGGDDYYLKAIKHIEELREESKRPSNSADGKELTDAQKERAATLKELSAALKAAIAGIEKHDEKQVEQKKAAAGDIAAATFRAESSGTFGASALWGLGTGGPVQQIADNTNQTANGVKELVQKFDRGIGPRIRFT